MIYALATLLEPTPREISVTVPPSRYANEPPMAADQRLIASFLDMIAAERGPPAIRSTLTPVTSRIIAGSWGSRGGGVLKAGAEDVRAYLADLDARGLKPASAARRLSAVRQLHGSSMPKITPGDDPTVAIAGPKRGRPLPKVLSIAEVDRLLSAAAEGAAAGDGEPSFASRFAATRMALLELLYATGMRVSELVALPAGAIRPNTLMLTVKGKGGKEAPCAADGGRQGGRWRAGARCSRCDGGW